MRFKFVVLILFVLLLSANAGNSYMFTGFCRDFDGINNINVYLNYNVYTLLYDSYNISSFDLFGGIDYSFSDDVSYKQLGYTVGISWTFLFVSVAPSYSNGFVRYKDYQNLCQVFFGANLPVNGGAN